MHCIFKTCIKTPTHVPHPLFLLQQQAKYMRFFAKHWIIIQIGEFVIYSNEPNTW